MEKFIIPVYSKDGLYKEDKNSDPIMRIPFYLSTFIICSEPALIAFIRTIMIYLYATMPEAEFLFDIGSVNDKSDKYTTIRNYIENVLASTAFHVVYSPNCRRGITNTPFYRIFESSEPGRDRNVIYADNLTNSIISKARNDRRLSLDEKEFIRIVQASIPVRNDPVSAVAAAAAAAAANASRVAPIPNSSPVAERITLEQSIFNYLTEDNPKLRGTLPSPNMLGFIKIIVKKGLYKKEDFLDLLKSTVFEDSPDSTKLYRVINMETMDINRNRFIDLLLEEQARRAEEDEDDEDDPSYVGGASRRSRRLRKTRRRTRKNRSSKKRRRN